MIYQQQINGNGYYKRKSVNISGIAYGLTSREINTYSGSTNYYAQSIVLKVKGIADPKVIIEAVKGSLKARKTRIKYNIVGNIAKGQNGFYLTIYNAKITAGIGYNIYQHWLTELEGELEKWNA